MASSGKMTSNEHHNNLVTFKIYTERVIEVLYYE